MSAFRLRESALAVVAASLAAFVLGCGSNPPCEIDISAVDAARSDAKAAEAALDEAESQKAQLQQQINKAIKDGVVWLKKAQRKDGSWGPVVANRVYGQKKAGGDRNRDETGPTAFALYTLASAVALPIR